MLLRTSGLINRPVCTLAVSLGRPAQRRIARLAMAATTLIGVAGLGFPVRASADTVITPNVDVTRPPAGTYHAVTVTQGGVQGYLDWNVTPGGSMTRLVMWFVNEQTKAQTYAVWAVGALQADNSVVWETADTLGTRTSRSTSAAQIDGGVCGCSEVDAGAGIVSAAVCFGGPLACAIAVGLSTSAASQCESACGSEPDPLSSPPNCTANVSLSDSGMGNATQETGNETHTLTCVTATADDAMLDTDNLLESYHVTSPSPHTDQVAWGDICGGLNTAHPSAADCSYFIQDGYLHGTCFYISDHWTVNWHTPTNPDEQQSYFDTIGDTVCMS